MDRRLKWFATLFLGIAWGILSEAAQASEPPEIVSVGEWSKPAFDTRGSAVRGRLVLGQRRLSEERREVAVYVELQDASEAVGGSMRIFCDFGKSDHRPENKSGLQCELRDKQNRVIPATGYPFSGAVPKSEWVTLPSDSTLRLRASPFGIHRPHATTISPTLGHLWIIADNDPVEYFLSGTFTVDPDEGRNTVTDPHIWRGTLVMPPVPCRVGQAAPAAPAHRN